MFSLMLNLCRIWNVVALSLIILFFRFACAEPRGIRLIPLVKYPLGLPPCPVNPEYDDPVSSIVSHGVVITSEELKIVIEVQKIVIQCVHKLSHMFGK